MLPALGIGALIGALGAKQRGGNMITGALTGAALGGIGGWLGGGKAVAGIGGKKGLFGFGTGWKGSLLPAAMIGMGTEMFGQQEANRLALEGRRRLFQEEEEERLRRLSEIAGYNVADPKHFLTPQSYFSADGGIVNTRQGYYNGGSATLDYTDPDLYTPTGEGGGPGSNPIMQLPLGPEGSFTDEFEELDLAGLTDEEMAELQSLQSLSIVTPEDDPQYERIQIRLQELLGRLKVARGGRVHAKRGIYLGPDDELEDNERYDEELLDILGEEGAMFHGDYDVADEWKKGGQVNRPGYFLGGLSHLLRSGKAGDMAEWYDKELMDDKPGPAAPLWMLKEWMKRQEEKGEDEGFTYSYDIDGNPTTFSLDEKIETVEGGEDKEGFDTKSLMLGPPRGEDTGASGHSKKTLRMILNALRAATPMAQGGIADLDMRGGGASFGPGTGTSDDVPAMLSDGEFVMTANAVRNLGGGDRMVGARRMYNMMNQLDPNSQTPGEMNVAGYG